MFATVLSKVFSKTAMKSYGLVDSVGPLDSKSYALNILTFVGNLIAGNTPPSPIKLTTLIYEYFDPCLHIE